MILDFGVGRDFEVIDARSVVLETNWDVVRIKGRFKIENVVEDDASALRVELLEDEDERKLAPRYVELKLLNPIVLPLERPYAITVRVKGNGGWGRIMFELVDAKGRIWTSCGNHYAGASNSSDNKAHSWVNFVGWQTMTIPLPGQYPGRDQFVHWPGKYDWWPTNTPEAVQREKAHQEALRKYEDALARYEKEMAAYEDAKREYEIELWCAIPFAQFDGRV